MASEDGESFIKNLAQFVRTHEKALANALQLRRQNTKPGLATSPLNDNSSTSISTIQSSTSTPSTSGTFAAAFSLGSLNFTSHNVRPAKLTLTAHHLFYLLSRCEELGIMVGPMNVRLENIHADTSPANYVSFLSQSQRSKGRSDRDSIHSVSSVRSVMSGMSSLWSNFGIGSTNNAAKTEKAKAQLQIDLKYLYSAFTKIPCLRLSPDRKARLIAGYEEFPFDTAVPLLAFKNLSALEICDVDFRQFYGWDKLAEQLRSLTLKRAHVDDPTDVLIGIVLDDMDKRRRRSSKNHNSPTLAWPVSPSTRYSDLGRTNSAPGSPVADEKLARSSSPRNSQYLRGDVDVSVPRVKQHSRTKSSSPTRPPSSRQGSSYRHVKSSGGKIKRSGSGSSTSSTHSNTHSNTAPSRTRSSSNLLSLNVMPASKWRFLRHLSLADNGLTSMTASSLCPLANTLHSLDLSSNLFTEVPDCLATLTALRALNLSNCMIESLHSLARNPIPAITALNLRSNRLASIAGVERLFSLERLDLRDNRLQDPTEIARLTGIPEIREIWVQSNPFVRSHGNYRITIFNLFRSTPGHTEDIVLDATGPGYSERRQLRDRVAENEGVPVVRPPPIETDSQPQTPILVHDSGIESRIRPAPYETQSEIVVGSNRRRKGPKRRIVDLSVDDSQPGSINQLQFAPSVKRPQVAFADSNEIRSPDSRDPSPKTIPHTLSELRDKDVIIEQHSGNPGTEQPIGKVLHEPQIALGNDEMILADDLKHMNLNGEAYRRKVEALKDEFGSGWLRVLSEDAWNNQRQPERQESNVIIPDLPTLRSELANVRTTSHGIVSSGRTLG